MQKATAAGLPRYGRTVSVHRQTLPIDGCGQITEAVVHGLHARGEVGTIDATVPGASYARVEPK